MTDLLTIQAFGIALLILAYTAIHIAVGNAIPEPAAPGTPWRLKPRVYRNAAMVGERVRG